MPESDVIYIPMVNDLVAIVDSSDYALVAGFKWHGAKSKRTWYARSTLGIRSTGYKTLHMHQLILPNVGLIDHIDRDGLNNSKSNLRPATQSQNKYNSLGRKRLSRYKGVSRADSNIKPWSASIIERGHRYHLGHYKTEEEAAFAYDRAALQIAGEFACLNFPIKNTN